MQKVVFVFMVVLCVFGLGACRPKQAVDAAHNSRNSLNWEGVYTGVIPAADGPGIEVRLTLYTNETYEISYHYIDRGNSDFTQNGSFEWDNAGSIITLDIVDFPPYYQVGENRLTQLDMQGEPITGSLAENYVLSRAP
jgi:uncharacterized lipoprotein NlpE involved in copper resistance